jgi:TolA-binding protein
LGDDLLDGATRILIAPPTVSDSTQNLIKELQQEISGKKASPPDPALLLRKAERFIAKRNYYLARKALRHALALGADEATVKNRLRDIRRLEFPDSLYHAVSSDQGERLRSSEILERLEIEFDVTEGSEENQEVAASIEEKLEEIFQDNDARTILDFGVGLHEMGLYRPAEQLFARMVSEFPDFAFDAYYLAAVSKLARKDYAGAASILKKLSLDADRSELEKIQIYYALGELFEKMSQRDRSREFFKKVAELDANYRNIRHKLES